MHIWSALTSVQTKFDPTRGGTRESDETFCPATGYYGCSGGL